jgi:hypothetical protein
LYANKENIVAIFGKEYGFIGKHYKNHTHPPHMVAYGGVTLRNRGRGMYRSDDGKTSYTYTQLFGDIPTTNNWPK